MSSRHLEHDMVHGDTVIVHGDDVIPRVSFYKTWYVVACLCGDLSARGFFVILVMVDIAFCIANMYLCNSALRRKACPHPQCPHAHGNVHNAE